LKLNRREMLLASAAGIALTSKAESSSDGWYDKPMRWMQLAFVEDDPGNYDPQLWLDFFKRCHADAACLSAGGCVAFYPTTIPLHYRSKWLGDRDSFGELVSGCRKLGMNVIARTDPHGVHQDVYDAHPDWIAVDANGKKRRHWADPDFWITCALGPYNFEFMTLVNDEIMRKYQVDGIFSNRWAGSGMCYCEHCRQNFRAFSRMDLPLTNDPQNAARKQYIVWHEKRLFELWRLWDARIKAINPKAAYLANAGGGALSDLDMKTIGELAPTLFADRQARHGLMPPWMNGKNGKEYRATLGQKAIAGIFSVGLEDEYRWKDSVQNGDEIRLWVADGIAQGLRPWCTKFNAKPIDKRWMPVVEEIYGWHYQNESYLRNEQSLARVGVVYSQQTAQFYGGAQAHKSVEDPALGFYQALIEARIPFEMVHDRLLDAQHLKPFKTLILPNIAALSDDQCRQLTAFVEAGGGLVATFETSLYNEWGVKRRDFGLSHLFGANSAGTTDGPMKNSYLALNRTQISDSSRQLLAGLEETPRIVNAVNRTRVKSTSANFHSPLTQIPSYPDLPMEEVFARPSDNKDPGVFLQEVGRGRVVYFPIDIDRTFWEVLAVDHGTLLRNSVIWASTEPAPLTVKGRGVLDLAVWTQKQSMTVHIVNLTNPMMMKGPLREIIPIPAQSVEVNLPSGRTVKEVKFLVSQQKADYRLEDGTLHVQTPPIELHEVIAIDFNA
jgi:hypothetical protein